MDEIELSRKQSKGARAEELLKNELLQESFQYLREEYISAWKRTSIKEIDGRERLWLAVNQLEKIQDHLKKFAIDGKIASKDLANIKYPKP